MVTVPEAAEIIIKRSRYLSEAMVKGFINNSSLARYIKPEIEEMLVKKVNESSIIMALNRLKKKLKPHSQFTNIFKNPPTMIIRSNLALINLPNSSAIDNFEAKSGHDYFLALSKGISETILVVSNEIYQDIKKLLGNEPVSEFRNLSAITIHLPTTAINTPGVFYFFLKSLAWEGINIIEIISTPSELTLIFEDKEVNKAFFVLKSLFT